jgi:hypothetical protein
MAYAGHLALGKTTSKCHARKYLTEEKWIIIKNTHEAIIDQAVFNQVSEIERLSRQSWMRRPKTGNEPADMLRGLAFCSRCGRPLTLCKKRSGSSYYICAYCRNYSTHIDKKYDSDELLEALGQLVMERLEACGGTSDRIDEGLSEADLRQLLGCFMAQLKALYDSYCGGVISFEDYNRQRQEVLSRKREYQSRLEPALDGHASACHGIFALFRQEKRLSRELLAKVVSRVDVGGDPPLRVAYRRELGASLAAMSNEGEDS